jgi:hypothetical protein
MNVEVYREDENDIGCGVSECECRKGDKRKERFLFLFSIIFCLYKVCSLIV